LTINAPTFQFWSTVTVPSMVQSVFAPQVAVSSEDSLLPTTVTWFRLVLPWLRHCARAAGSGAV